MKIIFLDIDGVLNNRKSFFEAPQEDIDNPIFAMSELCFDKECVAELNRIIRETGAAMVMSSSWRLFFPVAQLALIRAGLPACIDWTRQAKLSGCRGMNISGWMEDWSDPSEPHSSVFRIESYVIIDDSSDMLPSQQNNFVNTDEEKGLTREDADRAIEILNSGGEA